jgi:hypothetical protein
MIDKNVSDSAATLRQYQLTGWPLYLIGTFDVGVTVLSQQVRALNFVWAALESAKIDSLPTEGGKEGGALRVAIVGGGFAGLTTAGSLLRKNAHVAITIFEQRDTILPLQQGSDSRWLHPRIYEWPAEGSEGSVAMLPVLNWTAARASDVVVQILHEWKGILSAWIGPRVKLYCSARHLQIHETVSGQLRLEWVGELRNPADGTYTETAGAAYGRSEDFDIVILATGFGLERDGTLSYWRNETIGQPSLDQPRRTFLVSGQGDGAMIDLLRLRISQFRQDRILDELFHGRSQLLEAIKTLHERCRDVSHAGELFTRLEKLEKDANTELDFQGVRDRLSKRLRRDTEVVLHLKVRKLADLFDTSTARISFQNKLLVYLLYKCGGFIPSSEEETSLCSQYGITADRVIRRHGTLRDHQLKTLLSKPLYDAIELQRASNLETFLQQDSVLWPGGYFGYPGRTGDTGKVVDEVRQHWRKEYLPGATELLVTAFCAAVAGALRVNYPTEHRLRVTLHRTAFFGTDVLLQQACDYMGTDDARGSTSAAARTFPVGNGTIGLAYQHKSIVRSRQGATPEQLRDAMAQLDLNRASRVMSAGVSFILAIPLLGESRLPSGEGATVVLGVMYVDSKAPNYFIDDETLSRLTSMATAFLMALNRPERQFFDRIWNVTQSRRLVRESAKLQELHESVWQALELVSCISSPQIAGLIDLNYDYSDYVPVQDTAT